MNKAVTFLNEVRSELEKITWPSRNEFIGSTIIVCILIAFFAVVLWGMDFCVVSLVTMVLPK